MPPSAPRHGQLDLALCDGRQELTHRLGLVDRTGQQHGARHCAAQGIILLQKCAQRLACIGSRHAVEQGELLVVQVARQVVQHDHAAAGLSLHVRNRVQLGECTRDNLLLFAQRTHGTDAVAQRGRLLKP